MGCASSWGVGMAMTTRCHYCDESVVFERGRGWRHLSGGRYMVFCEACGWKGAPAKTPGSCPQCGNQEVRDDHAVEPIFAEKKSCG